KVLSGDNALDGATMVIDHDFAVLTVGRWTVDRELTISGTRPLVVLASGAVTINRPIHAEAAGDKAGPGGSLRAEGAGGAGATEYPLDSGGGGGGYGSSGASGGEAVDIDITGSTAGGSAGSPMWGAAMSDFFGGASGGNGGDADKCKQG